MNSNQISKNINKSEKEKEALEDWKKELIEKLSKDYYFKSTKKSSQMLYVVNIELFINYEKSISGEENTEFRRSISDLGTFKTGESFHIFEDKNISIEQLPKVFVLNKTNIEYFNNKNDSIISSASIGYFVNKILTLQIFKNTYCFFFLYETKKIRQGYLKIIDTKKEVEIIKELQREGINKFLKKNKKTLDENEFCFKNNDFYM